ncbi:MAG: DUF3617 family protein [Pseudomonadota bacterium]
MNDRRVALAFLIAASLSGAANAEDLRLEDGLYEVIYRLELPHLEPHAVDRTATICIDQDNRELHLPPIPLLSQNDVFADCQIENAAEETDGFSYDIACTGRGAARATATYAIDADRFKSRITITQGAKNMTMTEVQRGRRLGRCD